MPADRDRPEGGSEAGPAPLPDVVTDATNDVGFLDTVGLDPSTIEAAIDRAFRSLAVGAVLTVHGVDTAELDVICGRDSVELITTIRHWSGGTTYTIRRRPTAVDDGAGPERP